MLRSSIAAVALALAAPAVAQAPYWQCAAFARQFSGIPIRGDAWTWWSQAEGRFLRGRRPRLGAVMSFTPVGKMVLGHLATVTGIRSEREITVTHANWSPIGGTRGQVERDVLVRDVSPANDWSEVRVWYAPTGALGTSVWPIDGFIYPERVRDLAPRMQVAGAQQSIDLLPADYAAAPRADVGRNPLRLGKDIIRLAQLEARRP